MLRLLPIQLNECQMFRFDPTFHLRNEKGAVGFIDWLGEKRGFKECNVKRTDAHDDIKHAVKARQKMPEASQTNSEGDKDNTEKRE
jgi:hypothetical protein